MPLPCPVRPRWSSALLAILKAGAAYLPLDPDYPAERLAYMLQDAQPACVLTSARIAQRLCPRVSLSFCSISQTRSSALAQQPETEPSDAERTEPLSPHNPAYVIYTSGSTGTPKGVVVTHQNVVRLFARDRSIGSTSAPTTSGRCSIPSPSTSRSGNCGARCCTAAGWWWCPIW